MRGRRTRGDKVGRWKSGIVGLKRREEGRICSNKEFWPRRVAAQAAKQSIKCRMNLQWAVSLVGPTNNLAARVPEGTLAVEFLVTLVDDDKSHFVPRYAVATWKKVEANATSLTNRTEMRPTTKRLRGRTRLPSRALRSQINLLKPAVVSNLAGSKTSPNSCNYAETEAASGDAVRMMTESLVETSACFHEHNDRSMLYTRQNFGLPKLQLSL